MGGGQWADKNQSASCQQSDLPAVSYFGSIGHWDFLGSIGSIGMYW
jgi:hypothetical protein